MAAALQNDLSKSDMVKLGIGLAAILVIGGAAIYYSLHASGLHDYRTSSGNHIRVVTWGREKFEVLEVDGNGIERKLTETGSRGEWRDH